MRKMNTAILLMCAHLVMCTGVYAQEDLGEDRQAIDHMISSLYPDNQAEVTIEPLQGGFSGDRIYRVTVQEDILVVRVNHKNKALDANKHEVHSIKNAYSLGIGPKLLYQADDFSVIAMEFVAGEPLSIEALKQASLLNTFASNLKKLHNGAKFNRSWSVFDYIRHATKHGIDPKFKQALIKLNNIEMTLAQANFTLKPSHNDIQKNNLFLVDGKKIQFIDWGDAGMSSPFWDLARSSIEFAFTPKQQKQFLQQYSDNLSKIDMARYWLMKQVFLLRTAIEMNKLVGSPKQDKLNDMIKIFEANDYPLNLEGEPVTWQQVTNHVLALFEKNTNSREYNDSLKLIQDIPN